MYSTSKEIRLKIVTDDAGKTSTKNGTLVLFFVEVLSFLCLFMEGLTW
ncbi:hypothetical protein KP78_27150 [Jeotgalibacillus soli]|uniref:Uncharacterized protein n=1 Tax=Jeotgalibacillus soli TaxID=889306 RepID=A0A0C2VL39_9BACL|nr:hypothetical protein KP78_27150 [Jeotgalibacillus soli]